MPRGKKKLSLEEQLVKIETDINNMESSLAELKLAKNEIEEQIRQKKLIELEEIILSSGLSFEEVKVLLAK